MTGQDPALDFVESDAFIHAVLALISERSRFSAYTAEQIQPSAPSEDDAILHALVGLAGIAGQLAATVEGWAVELDDEEARESAPSRLCTGELLR